MACVPNRVIMRTYSATMDKTMPGMFLFSTITKEAPPLLSCRDNEGDAGLRFLFLEGCGKKAAA